ncbi:uncharacterized protein LOC143468437 isoform X4 [Clavelina lepadiformis]|uniref:uncharacterized protein LOC143468437 isoform X4 n=1 Tax=Clavelina lepadiformis TaxID=159417 RepID=UPI004041D719
MILAGRFVRCLGVIVLLMSMARSDAADVSTCYQILQVSNHGGILIGDDISEAICFVQANCVLITSITVIRSPGLSDATWEITYGGCMPAAQCGELDCKALLSKSLQYTPFEVEIKNCTSSCCQEDLCNENNLDNEEEEITDWEDGNVNENQTMVPENIEEMTKAGQNVTEAHTIAPITAAEEIIPPDSSAPFCYQRTRIVDSNGIALIKEKERPCFPGWSCYMGIADLESVSGVNVGQLLYDGCISPLACQSNDCDVILGGRGLGFNNGMRAVNCSITCCQGDLCNIDDDDEEDEDEEITGTEVEDETENDAAVRHYMLDDATMTYDTARQHCIDRGRDLCSKSDICVNDEPILIGIQNGDQWTPVRDGYNDWVEVGKDNHRNGRGRVCYRHNEHYSSPPWGTTSGTCPPWNTQKTCDLKGHVFCCRTTAHSTHKIEKQNNDNGKDNAIIQHYTLEDATMTYDTARQYCINNGRDLCLKSDICVNNEPIIIGIQNGDQWTPVRDGYNDWVEVGNDNFPNKKGRVCYRHNEHYSAPPWGITAGVCPPWNTQKTCDLKGHVFCCRGGSVHHYFLDDATMTYDTARQHCIDNQADLCLKSDICINNEPILIGIQDGDQWTPVRDGYNDWVEIGNDNFPNQKGRVCYRHNEHYSAPSWGITAGSCPPWNTQKTCDLKSHVFCCRVPVIQHYTLDDATMTYDTARQHCIDNEADLCLKSDICVNNEPILIGIQNGDRWTPVRDGYNDWVEVGNDNNPNGRGRVCYRHNEHYSAPPWGITAGSCPPWNTQKTCDLKGHVFCCRSISSGKK